jgi:hypothetical protein
MRARKTFVAGVAAAAICAAPAASFAYGPGGGGNPTPPGFGGTISTTNVGPEGGSAVGTWHECKLKVVVPNGTFAHHVSVVISKIKNTTADNHLAKGEASVCAFGVGFFRDGMRIHVAKGRPSANLNFTGSPIAKTDHLYLLIPGGSVKKQATFSPGEATSTIRTTRELAIVRATS